MFPALRWRPKSRPLPGSLCFHGMVNGTDNIVATIYRGRGRNMITEEHLMALPHAAPGDLIDVQPYADRLAEAFSIALLRGEQLEVLRLVLHAGKSIPRHHLDTEATLQCIEGSVELRIDAATTYLGPGQLICLARDVPYSIHAMRDSSMLMTVVLPPQDEN